MDLLMLSRLQFAVATIFHFLFVPLTLGLSILIAVIETIYVKTGDTAYKRMAKFWGKLLVINFAVGVVTGIALEFQFGTNWSRYSQYVGDVFGPILAIEATVAFFLESVFLAVWVFGWEKLSPKAHAATMWLVAIGSNISAFWILAANAWMQHPVGYVLRAGRAELADFLAVITQHFALMQFLHTVSAAYILSGFFVMGISAYHILKRQESDFFHTSFRMGLHFALIFSLVEIVQGHIHGAQVAEIQPTKLAAMEAHWETRSRAPIYMFLIPDEENERNRVQILPVPAALSLLAYHTPNAVVKGLKDFPRDERPPVLLTFVAFRLMTGLGFLFLLLTAIGWVKRNHLHACPGFLRIMLYSIPLPYLACEAGWILAEVGRQPWIVYGVMKTGDAVSPIGTSQVAVSLVAFMLVYSLLGAAGFYLLYRFARKGPEPSAGASGGPRGVSHA
jgi:cytochrome d ubiquinol oxidase subunit I